MLTESRSCSKAGTCPASVGASAAFALAIDHPCQVAAQVGLHRHLLLDTRDDAALHVCLTCSHAHGPRLQDPTSPRQFSGGAGLGGCYGRLTDGLLGQVLWKSRYDTDRTWSLRACIWARIGLTIRMAIGDSRPEFARKPILRVSGLSRHTARNLRHRSFCKHLCRLRQCLDTHILASRSPAVTRGSPRCLPPGNGPLSDAPIRLRRAQSPRDAPLA